MEQLEIKMLNSSITQLRNAVENMKEELEDRFLTGNEIESINVAEDELEKGRTTSLSDLKTEIGLRGH